jgi:hypothetical protein
MLLPIETDLIRRDPSIPGLAIALDADAFLAALRRVAPGAEPRTAKITYVRYKPHSYCRTAYRIGLAGGDLDVDVRACRTEDFAAWLAECKPCVSGPLGPGRIILEDCAVVLTAFPNDFRLPDLRHLLDPVDRPELLRELLPGRPEFWQVDFRCLRYRPERRFVAQLVSERKTRAIVKAYTRKAYARARHCAGAFHSQGLLRIAPLLGSSDSRRLLAFEWMPGRLLSDLWTAPTQTCCEAIRATGAALAALHDQHPDGLSEWTPDATAADLLVVASELGFVCPWLAVRADEIARRLRALLVETPATPCTGHGDFSANQVLVDERDVAIIDLDWACYSNPADDLGNFIAQAERFALRGELDPQRVELFKGALLEGYGRATERALPQRIGLYTAVQLFRRARFPFRLREPDWDRRTESLVDRAEAILNGLRKAPKE